MGHAGACLLAPPIETAPSGSTGWWASNLNLADVRQKAPNEDSLAQIRSLRKSFSFSVGLV